jgi:hypothetical protein
MSNVALRTEQEVPTKQDQLCKLYSFKKEKARYRKSYIDWDKIKRANQNCIRVKAKHLSDAAKAILAPVIQKLEKGERVILNHKYISTITKCERGQNRNIIKQLESVLDITYHNCITIDGNKHRHSYEFAYYKQEIISQEDNSTAQFIERSESLNPSNQASSDTSIENKDIEYIRSNVHTHESNFSQNSQEVISGKNNTTQIIELAKEPVKPAKFKKRLANERKKPTRGGLKARVYKPFAYSKPKTLSDMLPLIDGSTCDELRSKSGRSFSDNFITQLVLKMSRDHRRRPVFNYRSGFIAYMVKALKHELHDAVKTGNIGFRFKANIPVNNNENQAREGLSDTLKPEPIELPKGTWGDICRRLIDIYDEHIYRNWLSKLIIFSDERDKFITLEAPSSFMKEWIETNYWDSIKKIGESVGLELRGISTQACLKGERVFAYGTTSEKVIENLPSESRLNGFQKISVFEIVDKLQKS